MLTVTKTRMYTHDKPSPELQAKINMPWDESWVWKSVFSHLTRCLRIWLLTLDKSFRCQLNDAISSNFPEIPLPERRHQPVKSSHEEDVPQEGRSTMANGYSVKIEDDAGPHDQYGQSIVNGMSSWGAILEILVVLQPRDGQKRERSNMSCIFQPLWVFIVILYVCNDILYLLPLPCLRACWYAQLDITFYPPLHTAPKLRHLNQFTALICVKQDETQAAKLAER